MDIITYNPEKALEQTQQLRKQLSDIESKFYFTDAHSNDLSKNGFGEGFMYQMEKVIKKIKEAETELLKELAGANENKS